MKNLYAPRDGYVHSVEFTENDGLHCYFTYYRFKFFPKTIKYTGLKMVEGDAIGKVDKGKKIAELLYNK